VERLKNAIRSGRIANAYIFSGPTDAGKEFTAINFAKALNCISGGEDSCDKCISCRKIDDGNHADVRLIRPEGTKLKIEQMRFLQRQGSYKPMEGNYKVYIITEAEKMSLEAANSLLKTLEEPPGAMVLILSTIVYSALLPTIRSRCQALKFSLVPQNVLKDELVERFDLPEPKAKWIAIRSQGRVGRALKLVKENELNQASEKSRGSAPRTDDVSLFLPVPGQTDEGSLLSIFKKAEELSKSQDSLDNLLSWYRDLLLIKQGCSKDLLIHSDKMDELEKIVRYYSDIQIEKLIRTTLRMQNLIQRNINPTLAIEVMLLQTFNTA